MSFKCVYCGYDLSGLQPAANQRARCPECGDYQPLDALHHSPAGLLGRDVLVSAFIPLVPVLGFALATAATTDGWGRLGLLAFGAPVTIGFSSLLGLLYGVSISVSRNNRGVPCKNALVTGLLCASTSLVTGLLSTVVVSGIVEAVSPSHGGC